jgi:hypothetical protein
MTGGGGTLGADARTNEPAGRIVEKGGPIMEGRH